MYARFAYITYCFKVTTPIRSTKKKTICRAPILFNIEARNKQFPILCDSLALNYPNFHKICCVHSFKSLKGSTRKDGRTYKTQEGTNEKEFTLKTKLRKPTE